jgi:hypothetical protein
MKDKMNCQRFQEVLPYIIESGGSAEEEEHLRTCPACAGLVEDLRYIATQAKLLLPMHDPSPRVWTGIEQALRHQGLIQEGRMSLMGHTIVLPTQTKSWTPVGWIMAAAALMAFSALLITYRPQLQPAPASAQNMNAQPTPLPADEQQLVSQVSESSPDVRSAYEDSLREVNVYISDAEQAVANDPQDTAAREQLVDAYQQKEMLYQMATARSLP